MILATLRFLYIIIFRFVGIIFYLVFRKRRDIAFSNVKKCYSALSNSPAFIDKNKIDKEKNIRRIVKESFGNLGQTLGDFIFLPLYTKENIDKYVELKNVEFLEEAVKQGRGVIVSTAHFGSWELAAHALALKGFQSLIIYNRFKRPFWLDKVVKRQRERSGNRLILKENSFFTLYRHIKRGGMTVMLTDQHAFPPDGEKVSFLGKEVYAHSTFVKMSIKSGAPIVPAYTYVKKNYKYVVEFGRPIDPKNFLEEEVFSKMHRKCHGALEKAVIKAPQLWMWQHRRFKKVKDTP